MSFKNIILIALLAVSSQSFAENDETKCKKMNDAYKLGLELAAKQVKQFPSAANKSKNGLSLKEIESLEKSMSACEVKARIDAALIKH
ncbi:hypothetical protein [Alteromonas sp. S167]|uniref:hypothetical protein n=1 Tax=Alteromonas sp. S167 TaxID=3117402 RepID=UPI002FE36B1F